MAAALIQKPWEMMMRTCKLRLENLEDRKLFAADILSSGIDVISSDAAAGAMIVSDLSAPGFAVSPIDQAGHDQEVETEGPSTPPIEDLEDGPVLELPLGPWWG